MAGTTPATVDGRLNREAPRLFLLVVTVNGEKE